MKYLNVVLLVAIIGLVSVTTNGLKVRYDNHHVYQLQPQTKEQLEVLKKLDGADKSVYFLDGVHNLKTTIYVIVAPEKIENFVQTLKKNSVLYELVDTNAQASLEHEIVADSMNRDSEYTWQEYHELDDTYNWLHSLEAKYPNTVSVIVAGKTYEGRQILGVKISYGPGRKAIFLEGGMHAREWIGPATVTYITNQLLTSEDKEVRMVAESFDWYIIPHANPDGYVFTHTANRLWRKTRTPYGNDCYGADPNRNWGFHWNEVGVSDNLCSEIYPGPNAFSEIETKSLSEYIATLKGKILLYISFHSYSQLLLFPYGHTDELPPNYDDLKRVLDVAIAAAAKRYGTKYTGGNVYNAIYPAAGSSVDWAYDEQDVKYSFCYELRPSLKLGLGLNGFILPADQIIPTGEETLDSVIAMIKEVNITTHFL